MEESERWSIILGRKRIGSERKNQRKKEDIIIVVRVKRNKTKKIKMR